MKEGDTMRLIDADELKEAMEEHTDYKGYLVCDPEEIIDLAPTIEIPQWIPCTDRLPDKDGDYIATYTFCDKQVVNKVHYSKHLGFFYNSVIAWMPLPAPYMKEGD